MSEAVVFALSKILPGGWVPVALVDKVPIDRPRPLNAIEQAEAQFPGVARWFPDPLWRFLKHQRFDAGLFDTALRALEPAVVQVLFENEPREHERGPQQRPFDYERAAQLIALASFDALVAALLLAGLSEEIASPELRERALHVYIEIQAALRQMPIMVGIYPDLFFIIDSRCNHWVYLSPNQRMDVVIFWPGVEAEVERQSTEQAPVITGR